MTSGLLGIAFNIKLKVEEFPGITLQGDYATLQVLIKPLTHLKCALFYGSSPKNVNL